MSVSVSVPALGESITEAIIAEWVKSEGDFVQEDEIIVELETDKITVSVPAPVSGVLTSLKGAIEDTVNVGDVIAVIDPQDAPADDGKKETAKPVETKTASTPTKAPEPSQAVSGSSDAITPAVARLLEENGLNAGQIPASGPNGRILKGDVLAYLRESSNPPVVDTNPEPTERVKMSRLRQTVAKRLVEAQQTAAMLTTFNEVDMSAIMDLRTQYKGKFVDKHGFKLGFMSFFLKACIEGLKGFPAVNAEIDGDEIVYKNFFHIGVAVGGKKGLVVPVVKHADRLSFAETEAEIGRLAGLARDNKLALSDLQGGTFTISNGGIYGSMLSTPILNPPQVGILGMHNIVERAVVIDGEIVIRPMMYLALSYDHRIIDGKEAVSFLVRVKECIEQPERILLEI